jgi:2-polyprenyl-3-methyl-5-hydroxy-6-metoxy-1,4-benzoquinol methylase
VVGLIKEKITHLLQQMSGNQVEVFKVADKTNDLQETYDEYYYLTSCGSPYVRGENWLNFFGSIADQIVKDINPKKVLDAGCAKGFLVEALRDRGVDAYGIDISEYAISQVRVDMKNYCKVGSILEPFNEQYDLIITIEVLEHLSAFEGRKAIENLCKYTNDIIFTSTPSDYKEATHFNVQPVEYWVEIFAQNGFIKDVEYDVSYITNHAMRFKKEKIDLPRVLGKYERHLYKIFIENNSLREAVIESRNTLAMQDGKIQEHYQKDEEFNRLLSEKDEEIRQAVAEKDEEIRQAVAEKEHEIEQLRNDLQESRAEAKAQGQEILKKSQELDELQREIVELHVSRSWRYTRPVRRFMRLIRRIWRYGRAWHFIV